MYFCFHSLHRSKSNSNTSQKSHLCSTKNIIEKLEFESKQLTVSPKFQKNLEITHKYTSMRQESDDVFNVKLIRGRNFDIVDLRIDLMRKENANQE